MSINIGSQLISKLGSPNSKIPLAVKDIVNSAGYTYFSYDAGGKVEGKDRLVDEVGTGLIWLFGIPTYRKIIDNTIFRAAKINPEVDVRVLKNSDYLKSAIQNAPTQQIAKELEHAGNNITKTKGMTFLKFGLSLLMTMASYFALTKFKQNMTKKAIEKEFYEKQQKNQLEPDYKTSKVFDEFKNNKGNKNPSFGSSAIVNLAEEFMLNPVKNMIILDAGISGSRIKNARTKGEKVEYGIKEGSFLFFVYGAGKLITKGIDKLSELLLNAPISLDSKFLSTKSAENLLKDPNLQNEVKEFASLIENTTNTKELYDFIFENQNNIVIKAAKKSGIISTIKDSTGQTFIDTRKYINIKEIKKLISNLSKFIDKSKDQNILNYLKKVKALKVASTILNVGICCFALGYLVPKKIYEYRAEHQNGKNDFHVKTEYEKELLEKQSNRL